MRVSLDDPSCDHLIYTTDGAFVGEQLLVLRAQHVCHLQQPLVLAGEGVLLQRQLQLLLLDLLLAPAPFHAGLEQVGANALANSGEKS